jgi:hypothetical protein
MDSGSMSLQHSRSHCRSWSSNRSLPRRLSRRLSLSLSVSLSSLSRSLYLSCSRSLNRSLCRRNLITGLAFTASKKMHISKTCNVGQKHGVSLPLLTCSFLPCLSWLLCSQVRKSQRVIHKSLTNFRTRLRHFSSGLSANGRTCRYAKAHSTKKLARDYLTINTFLSVVSVFVVAQSYS